MRASWDARKCFTKHLQHVGHKNEVQTASDIINYVLNFSFSQAIISFVCSDIDNPLIDFKNPSKGRQASSFFFARGYTVRLFPECHGGGWDGIAVVAKWCSDFDDIYLWVCNMHVMIDS